MKLSLFDRNIPAFIRRSGFWAVLLLILAGPATAIGTDGRAPDVWDGSPLPVAGIKVEVEKIYPDDVDWPDLVTAVTGLYLAPDQILTRENLILAEKALSPFGRVRSNVAVSGQQVNVVFLFVPHQRIKSIAVKGNYPLFERDVRNALRITVGDVFLPQELAAEEERVVQLYLSEGYINPEAKITWQPDPSDGHLRLVVGIDEGPFYRMTGVEILGNRQVAEEEIQAQLWVWYRAVLWGGLGRFKPAKLKEDIEKLTRYYRSLGYFNARIEAQTVLDSHQQTAVVTISVEEGPYYSVAFEGNAFFSESDLRKELVLEETGNLENKGLRRSIQALRKRYLEAGFSDVQVRAEETADEGDKNIRALVFAIDEGTRWIVNRVSFLGVKTLDNQLVQDQVLTRPPKWPQKGVFVKQVLEEDLAALRALYLDNGFLSTRVSHEVRKDADTGRVDVTFTIDEGVRTRVRHITVEGDFPMAAEKLKKALQMKSGDVFRPYGVEAEQNLLSAKIAVLGYPHVQTHGKFTLSEDGTGADIVYAVDSGPLVKVGQIFILGNFRTRKNFIKHQFGVEPGQIFSLQEVVEGQREVRNLRIFDSVQLNTIGLKEKAATVPLLISVAEKEPYYFELGGGYQSDKGFYGRTRVGDNNWFGSGKKIWTGLEASEVGYRGDVGFNEPRFLGIHLGLDIGLYIENSAPFNQDFGTDIYGGAIGLSRKWGQYFNTRLGVRYEERQQFRQNDEVVVEDPTLLERRAVLVTTPAVSYDDRDSFIQPRKGLLASLAVDISKGLDNSLDDYLKYRLDTRWFQPLTQDLVLSARLGVGYLHPYGDTTEVPQDQLFFLGGTTTVRGFAENLLRQDGQGTAIGGQLAVWGSLEGRYQLWRNWELALFVDGGSISKTVETAGSDDFRWSAGLGLAYVTPIGPIGLFYGHKLKALEGESPGQLHFSIGYTF